MTTRRTVIAVVGLLVVAGMASYWYYLFYATRHVQSSVEVEAPDADTAIQVAIKEFEVTNPEHQTRLAARRVE
jgi:hypothetical protein